MTNDATYRSVEDFCRRTSISRSFAYKLMRAGKLPFINVGRRRLIPVSAEQSLGTLCTA